MGVALVTVIERGGEAQMWDKAPGPLPDESEVEEGSEEKGSEKKGHLPGQASSAGFQAQHGAGPGRLHFPCHFPPQQGKQGFQGPLLHCSTPLSLSKPLRLAID